MADSCDSQFSRNNTDTAGPFWFVAMLQFVSPFLLIPFGLSIGKIALDSGNGFAAAMVNSALILWLPLIVFSWIVYFICRSS